jgi:hypothetical protein
MLNKISFEEATRIPTLDEIIDKQSKELVIPKGDELLSLGFSQQQGNLWVTQAERENHFWVLGSTGEGKSRFLEYLIRRDIDRLQADRHLPKNERKSCSLCFIDPTPQGKIAYNVLNYCASIGFKKVFIIDAHQINITGKVPPINPFNYNKSYIVDSVDYLKDAFRVLFDVEDESKTAYITTYLTAVFTVLHYAGLTLRELIYFTLPFDKTNELTVDYRFYRDEITAMVKAKMDEPEFPRQHKEIVEKHLSEIEFAFKNIPNFTKEFGSTARRINTLVNNPNLSMMLGHRKGINFDKLITDGWVLLVNASTGGGIGTLQSRLLSTIIINQIIFTIERLRTQGINKTGFNKPYYLYLDEAELYATDKLVEVLDTKRNIKMRMILSNHSPKQFKPKVREAVQRNAKTKIAFYVGTNDDRMEVAREMYGGDLKAQDVEYALRQQQKRQAVMKLNKKGSVIAKTHEVPDIEPNKQFLEDLLSTKNYATINEILDDYEDRFAQSVRGHTKSSKSRQSSNRKTTSKADVPPGIQSRRKKSSVSASDEKPQNTGKAIWNPNK